MDCPLSPHPFKAKFNSEEKLLFLVIQPNEGLGGLSCRHPCLLLLGQNISRQKSFRIYRFCIFQKSSSGEKNKSFCLCMVIMTSMSKHMPLMTKMISGVRPYRRVRCARKGCGKCLFCLKYLPPSSSTSISLSLPSSSSITF